MRPLVASITAKISDNSTSVHIVLHTDTHNSTSVLHTDTHNSTSVLHTDTHNSTSVHIVLHTDTHNSTSVHIVLHADTHNSTSVLHAGTQQVLFGSVGYFAPALLRILVFITKNISVTN